MPSSRSTSKSKATSLNNNPYQSKAQLISNHSNLLSYNCHPRPSAQNYSNYFNSAKRTTQVTLWNPWSANSQTSSPNITARSSSFQKATILRSQVRCFRRIRWSSKSRVPLINIMCDGLCYYLLLLLKWW